MSSTSLGLKENIIQKLPAIVLGLFVLQPILDVVSYWQIELGLPNFVTFAFRALMLLVVSLAGLILSDNKKSYFVLYGVCAFLVIGHIAACILAGKSNDVIGPTSVGTMITDLSNQLRIYQLPLFTFSFITFIKKNDKCVKAIQNGFLINLCMIVLIEIISVLTKTEPYTYSDKQIGICGWFYFHSAQSAILCMIVPIAVYMAWKMQKKYVFPIVLTVGCLVLFLFGTRLCYAGLFISVLGFLITLILTKKVQTKDVVILVACILVFALAYGIAPMNAFQDEHLQILAEKQADIDQLIERGIQQYGTEDPRYLEESYAKYAEGLVDRFGIDTISKLYDYSRDAATITAARGIKLKYCKLLMNEMPFMSKLFGMELRTMTYDGYVYDVENDFHGIYYLCGGLGLVAMVSFIGYFVFEIVKVLLKDAKKYFTVEAGATGIALILGLLHCAFTAGVLRRPQSSFYLSAILALIFYFVKIKYEISENDI